MGHGQGLRQLVQGAAAHGAVGALGAAILLVALSVLWVKEGLWAAGSKGDQVLGGYSLPRAHQVENKQNSLPRQRKHYVQQENSLRPT